MEEDTVGISRAGGKSFWVEWLNKVQGKRRRRRRRGERVFGRELAEKKRQLNDILGNGKAKKCLIGS